MSEIIVHVAITAAKTLPVSVAIVVAITTVNIGIQQAFDLWVLSCDYRTLTLVTCVCLQSLGL